MKLDADLTKRIINKLASDRGVKIYYKPDSKVMWVIGWVVAATTKLTHKQFMNDFSTAFRGDIYLKFRPGDESYSFPNQISHVGHELTHTDQERKGSVMFQAEYLGRPGMTAIFEAEALCVNLEFTYLYVNRNFDWKKKVEEYGNRLKNYRCSEDDIKGAKAYMTSFMATLIEVNQPITDVGISIAQAFKHFGVINA